MSKHAHGGGRWLRRRKDPLDSGDAFLQDFRLGFVPIDDGDVEAFGEEFVAGATSNEPIGELARDELYAEELDGVVLETEPDDSDSI